MNKNKEDNMINEKYSEIDKTEINKFKIFSSFFMITVLTILSRTTNRKEKNILEDSSKQIDDIYESISNQKIEFILKECFDNKKERSKYAILDFDISYASKIQKEFLNDTARLITKFHEQTHKENNFRLEEDDEHYLDLTLDEVISLNIMLNEYSEEEMTEIFGSYKLDSQKIDSSIKSLYDKLIVYYMNAKEKSYISDIIKDEEKKKMFEDIEEKVLRFNNASSLNLDDIYNDEIYQKITSSNFEDFKSYIQIIPFMGAIMKNSNLEENSKIISNNQEKLESIINDKAIIIDAKIIMSNIKYLKKYTMILLNSLKDKDDEVLKMTRNLERTYKNIYGIDIKNYISEEEIKKIVSDFYELTLIDKKIGLTLNKVEDKINLSKLDGIYELTDQKTVNKLIDIRKDKKLKKSKRLIRIN